VDFLNISSTNIGYISPKSYKRKREVHRKLINHPEDI